MNDNTCSDLTVSTDAIKASPLGDELSDAQCELLASVMTACGIRDRDFLIEEGHKDDSLHILTKGNMEAVTQTGATGRQLPARAPRLLSSASSMRTTRVPNPTRAPRCR